jgi:hypothetical protein
MVGSQYFFNDDSSNSVRPFCKHARGMSVRGTAASYLTFYNILKEQRKNRVQPPFNVFLTKDNYAIAEHTQ